MTAALCKAAWRAEFLCNNLSGMLEPVGTADTDPISCFYLGYEGLQWSHQA